MGVKTGVWGKKSSSERSEVDRRRARGTFKDWQSRVLHWQCRLKSNGFEECAERRLGMCSSYLSI